MSRSSVWRCRWGTPAATAAQAPPGTPIYLNPVFSAEERAADLVSRLTLAEKASQMNSSQSAAIPRLGDRGVRLVERGRARGGQRGHAGQREPADPDQHHLLPGGSVAGQVDVAGFEPNVAALLWSLYNGQRKGESLADVLLGAHNPSGHLPFSWYRDLSQLPPIGDYAIRPAGSNLGRTYMYFKGQVSYPFGHGLSYGTYRLSRLHVDRKTVDANDTLRVSANVTNTGRTAGDEVVQLYVSTPDAPAALERPLKRLRGFQKVSLAPHQTKRVNFTVKVPDLAFFDQSRSRYVVDAGTYGIQLGTSSADADIRERATVTVRGALRPTPSVVTAKPAAAGDAIQGIPNRVFFPPDVTVDPQLTVAMSDDSLFGYITKGAGRPLPPGLRSAIAATVPASCRPVRAAPSVPPAPAWPPSPRP